MPLSNPITEPQIPQPIARDSEVTAAIVNRFITKSGITALNQGGIATLPLSLVGDTITGVQVLVRQSPNAGVSPSYIRSLGYMYDWYYDPNFFYLINHPSDSYNILGKPFSVIFTCL
ncbi:hypothetical protein QUA26_28935 [Microcoleus sp. Pol12A4]|uniref:hypothetical protein n=1 Tax=unclassified Microcoleus TaxID=2642155 RepID=UPI002FD3F6BC